MSHEWALWWLVALIVVVNGSLALKVIISERNKK